MALDAINSYPNHHAKHALGAPIAVLLAWLVSRLVSGMFDFLRRRKAAAPVGTRPPVVNPNLEGGYGAGVGGPGTVPATTTGAAATAAPVSPGGEIHRTTNALRDLFIWTFAAWVVNILANGFTEELVIFIYVVAALGILWALLRKPLRKFADIILLPVAAGVAFLFINAVTDGFFGNPNRL